MTDVAKMLAVSQTAHRLASGYYAFLVAQFVAANPQSINMLPPSRHPEEDPVGEIQRKDGTAHALNLRFYLDRFREDRDLQTAAFRSWALGAILMLGDELSENSYFDNAPLLELVRHLRNGVAHGNRFNITEPGRRRLARFPAHNRDAVVKSPSGETFEVIPSQSGHILFEFMGVGDVIDLLQSVEVHLSNAASARQ